MSKKKKIKKDLLAAYHDPSPSGSLGGVRRFAEAHGLTFDQAQTVLEKDLGYTLHQPRRRRFQTLPVVVEGLDHQWVADLVEVQTLSRFNRGYRYLLTVIDVLSKYAWVQPKNLEFPGNVANSFKNRLTNPLFLMGDGWKVGLTRISLPDSRVNLSTLTYAQTDDLVLSGNWSVRRNGKDGAEVVKTSTVKIHASDFEKDASVVDGVSLMATLVNLYDQKRTSSALFHDHLTDPNSKDMFITFKWTDRDELLIDNSYTSQALTSTSIRPTIGVGLRLALKMGWVVEDHAGNNTKSVKLGPNLRQELIGNTVPVSCDLVTDKGQVFLRVNGHLVELSVFCNWRFVNLNKAFFEVVGNPNRTFHVYSNVCASSLMGNKVRDLLREIRYKREGGGSVYFEPLHVQYIPVRNTNIETIETEVAESETGQLVNFGKGEGILTLHFKKET